MSEEAFKKECLNSCELKILEMYGVLQRQILFCGTGITAAAREVSTLSVACSMDLGAGGFPFLKAYLLGGFLWMLSPAPRPGLEERRCRGETYARVPLDSHLPASTHC